MRVGRLHMNFASEDAEDAMREIRGKGYFAKGRMWSLRRI